MHHTLIPFAIAVALILIDTFKRNKIVGLFGYLSIILGLILFVTSFLNDDFTSKEVFMHSSKYLDPIYKLSASWAGSGGFIVWWLSIFTILTIFGRLRSRTGIHHNLMILGLISASILNGAFDSLNFVPRNGLGLNPLLKSFWMLIHPPACFIGYALGFFIAIDVLLKRESKILIGLTWIFITLANILGGVWSYFTLGWGGYWAWDPVETGLLLPWLSLTACFHNPKLKKSLISLTGFSVAFAGFVTRGGISPLHGFAVNPSCFIIVVLGIPFLIKSLRDWRFDSISPTTVATYSLIGCYVVCFLGLVYQFFGKVSVDYYNFANLPFVLAFLSVLPICTRDLRGYSKVLILVYMSSTILLALTILGHLNWCRDAPLHVNAAISITLPVSIFSLLSIFGLKRFEHKILHISISIFVISAILSWPYAYYSNYKPIFVDKYGSNVDGFEIKLISKDFYMGKEESYEVVKVKFGDEYFENRIKLDLNWLMSGEEFMFPEPTILNFWLDNYYFVMPKSFDLFMFTCKSFYERNDTFALMLISHATGFEYHSLIDDIEKWNPRESVMIAYKKIPLINLLWISCATMLIGEVIAIVRWGA